MTKSAFTVGAALAAALTFAAPASGSDVREMGELSRQMDSFFARWTMAISPHKDTWHEVRSARTTSCKTRFETSGGRVDVEWGRAGKFDYSDQGVGFDLGDEVISIARRGAEPGSFVRDFDAHIELERIAGAYAELCSR